MWPRILTRTTGVATPSRPSRTLFSWLVGAFLLTLLPHVAQLPGWLTASILVADRRPLRRGMETLAAAHHHLHRRRRRLPARRRLSPVRHHPGPRGRHALHGRPARDQVLRNARPARHHAHHLLQLLRRHERAALLAGHRALRLLPHHDVAAHRHPPAHLHGRPRATTSCCASCATARSSSCRRCRSPCCSSSSCPATPAASSSRFNDAVTGISDHVEPGSIARLANDDSPAMRVSSSATSHPMPDSHVLARHRSLAFRRPDLDPRNARQAQRYDLRRPLRPAAQPVTSQRRHPAGNHPLARKTSAGFPPWTAPSSPPRTPISRRLVPRPGRGCSRPARTTSPSTTSASTSSPPARCVTDRRLALEEPRTDRGRPTARQHRPARAGPRRPALRARTTTPPPTSAPCSIISGRSISSSPPSPAALGKRSRRRISLPDQERILRTLRLRLRRSHAPGKRPHPHGRRLSRRRVRSLRRLLSRQPVERPRLGRGLDGGDASDGCASIPPPSSPTAPASPSPRTPASPTTTISPSASATAASRSSPAPRCPPGCATACAISRCAARKSRRSGTTGSSPTIPARRTGSPRRSASVASAWLALLAGCLLVAGLRRRAPSRSGSREKGSSRPSRLSMPASAAAWPSAARPRETWEGPRAYAERLAEQFPAQRDPDRRGGLDRGRVPLRRRRRKTARRIEASSCEARLGAPHE